MRAVHSALIHRRAAALAASTTTMALFSAVVAISEPHRSGLVAANAARHATHARAQAEPPRAMSIAAAGPLERPVLNVGDAAPNSSP